MEVDLLKAGSVPISPDTVLSFEFLLDKELLLKHLQKPNPDPTPLDLITKFHDVITTTLRNRIDPETIESTTVDGSNEVRIHHPAKNIAMKILSLKVAAFLNWNLAQIRSLPFKTQIDLLQDLMYFTSEEKTVFEITNLEQIDLKSTSPEFLFALVLFHRWALNTSMHRVTSNWQQRYGVNEMSLRDENIICCPENIKKTISFLHESLQWERMPKLLSFDCFQMPTETNDSIEFNWNKATHISKDEFCAQICYDLGTSFFYQEDYKAAKEMFHKCQEYSNLITQQNGFAFFDKNSLHVYITACDPSVDVHKKSLLEQLNNSIVNQFVGITNVLQQDNVQKEIPLTHRINLELDIQGALSSGVFTVARDLLYKVKALNYVRCILEKKFLNEFSLTVSKNIDAFIWAIQVNWKLQSNEDRKIIKDYLLHLIIKQTVPDLMERIKANSILGNIFEMSEQQYVNKTERIPSIPENLFASDTGLFDTSKKRKPKMDLRLLVRQLVSSYNWKEIKDIILKIGVMNMGASVWDMNPHWEVPIPIHSVLKSLPRGFLSELSYVLLAKSKEQLLTKNWNLALELLIVLDKELQNANFNVSKLCKMVNWEILLIQILQLMEEWPKSTVDKTALANACEVCLQSNESVIPRTEIVESCAICLLNLGRWEFLIAYEKRWTSFEIMSAVALACHEMVKNKCSKKFSKDLWDIVLPVFGPNPSQSKRSSSSCHDINNLRNNLLSIFLRLKDSTCLTVVISMLTKLYNIFKDEANFELQVDYMNLWPATISNANSYNINTTSEMLCQVLIQGIKEYPTNIPWLRVMGDINYANGNYKISLSFYLKSLIICNDYFNIPVRYDDHVFRRMIKCCLALGCYTQAAVLCQFLEEPDYALAFRILSEQKSCNDAVDAYYHCFWDTNILEYLIHIHNRRGEYQRRKCAIQVVGMLELNSSNNQEIQREASNLRKSIFLRALCKMEDVLFQS